MTKQISELQQNTKLLCKKTLQSKIYINDGSAVTCGLSKLKTCMDIGSVLWSSKNMHFQ